MRIGSNYSQGSPAAGTQSQGTQGVHGKHHHGAPGAAPASAGGGAAKVTVSAKARELDQTQSVESSAKVQRLQAAVAQNQLSVDPDKIAAAIVGE